MALPRAAKAKAADKPRELRTTRTSGPASSSRCGAWKTSAVAKSKERGPTHAVSLEAQDDESATEEVASESSSDSDDPDDSDEYDPFAPPDKDECIAPQERQDEAEDCAKEAKTRLAP